MKICLISPVFSKNLKEATNITLIDFATQLTKFGHEVIIVAEHRSGFEEFEMFRGIAIHRGKSLSRRGSILAGLKSLKGRHFDILHSFSSAIPLTLFPLIGRKYFPGSKSVHTIKSKSASRIGNLGKLLLKRFDLVTTSTGEMQRFLGIGTVLPSHIDVKRFIPGNVKQNYVLYYGAMRDDKGTYDLLQAMALVAAQVQVKFIYICRFVNLPPHYQPFLERDYVKLITCDVEIEKYVREARLAVFPYRTLTRTESNPSCVLESLASKTLVITTNLTGLQEILLENQDCLMVTPSDPEALANKIIYALKNQEALGPIVEHGYRTAQRFSVERVSKLFEAEYFRLVA
jgi:glycosyltransferase involved in cell wall biosynthesis